MASIESIRHGSDNDDLVKNLSMLAKKAVQVCKLVIKVALSVVSSQPEGSGKLITSFLFMFNGCSISYFYDVLEFTKCKGNLSGLFSRLYSYIH